MASYHLSVHPNVSRGKGQSLARTAAYNGRTRLVDERTGEAWDYRRLGAALAENIYAPKGAPTWASDLQQLVNHIEASERRSDAQLAMNLDIALPCELTLEQNRRLMGDFVREEFMRKGYVAHFAIHAPDPKGDDRNIHAHVLVSLRKLDTDGFARTKTEQQDNYRNRSAYVEELREKWERLGNRHLERAGFAPMLDRRSLQGRGVDREPEQHRGPSISALERRGETTEIGEQIRQRQALDAERRALKAEELRIDAEIIDLQAERARRQAKDTAPAAPAAEPPKSPTMTPPEFAGASPPEKDVQMAEQEPDGTEAPRAEEFGKAAFEATGQPDFGPERPDVELRAAWLQPEFSRATIEADPWTAVYLPIPEKADAWLLMTAHDAAHECEDWIARGPGTGPRLQQGDDGPEENRRQAAARVDELAHRIELAPRPGPRDFSELDRPAEIAQEAAEAPEPTRPEYPQPRTASAFPEPHIADEAAPVPAPAASGRHWPEPEQPAVNAGKIDLEGAAVTAADKGGNFMQRAFAAIGDRIGDLINFASDIFAPPPAPTAQQVHEMKQAAGNVETLHAEAVAAETVEIEASRDEQIARDDSMKQMPLAAPEYFRAIVRSADPADRRYDHEIDRDP